MRKLIFLTSIFLFAASIQLRAQGPFPHYSVSKVSVEGDGGWDEPAVDDATHRLFISHGNVTQVLNTGTGKLVGTIPDTKGVHAIDFAHDLDKGFISNGKDTSVTIFKLSDLSTITKVKIDGLNPDAIIYDQHSHKVLVFSGRSKSATVIDAATNKVTNTIPLDGKPEFAVTDNAGHIYVNMEDRAQVAVINSTTFKVENYWTINPGAGPSGIAIDIKNRRLFSVCGNRLLIVLDATTGDLVAQLPIGDNVDGVAFDPALNRIYSSNGEGTLTVIQEESPNKFTVLDNVKTQKGARTLALSIATHHLYLPTAEYGPKPEPTTQNPHPRAEIKPGTFVILDIAPGK